MKFWCVMLVIIKCRGEKSLKKIYNKIFISIKNRILFIFAGCILLPGLVFCGIFIHNYSEYILESTISEKQNVLYGINKNINQYFSGYKDTSMNIYYNDAIISYLNGNDYEEKSDYISNFLSGIVNSEKYIAAAVMKIRDTTYQAGYNYLELNQLIARWEDKICEKKGRVVWLPTEQFKCAYGQKPYQFVMARSANSKEGQVGILLFFISSELFKEFSENPAFHDEGTELYLLTEDLQVVTSTKKDEVLSKKNMELFRKIRETEQGNFVYKDNDTGQKRIVVCEKSSVSGWYLATVTEQNAMYSKLYTIWKMIWILGGLYVGFMILAYSILSVCVFKPLNRLSKGMKKVSSGSFEHISEQKRGENEIGQLIQRYNEMVDQISFLMCEVREEEKAKTQERLKVLSMQISPHFIYNTLNTIRWMASANRQDHISKMIDSLIKIMKSVTYNTNEEITLKEEMQFLESYIYIQKMRFLNFEMEYDIPSELLSYKVNKLVLQPFVENCIVHAFKNQEDFGVIYISARKQEKTLEIKVEDNGVGFDMNLLDNSEEEKGAEHVGIKNVSERIRLNYGKDYGIHIKSEKGKGTRVTINLPIIK